MTIVAETSGPFLVRSILGHAAAALLGHTVERLTARRRRRRLRRTVLAYRRLDNRMLDDIGLSTALIEGALSEEADATDAFVRWIRARRIA